MHRILVALLVLAAAAAFTAPADALPGDPPIELRSPANGATVVANAAGIQVAYTCPLYRSADYGDGTGIINGEDAYTVLLSDSPTLDSDGRLANPETRNRGASRPEDPSTCYAALGDPDANPGPQETPGTWYWQVSRICSFCSPQYENSEVRSFTIAPAGKPTLKLPGKLYGGYPVIGAVTLKGLPGNLEVTVERKTGSRWTRAGAADSSAGGADVVTTLPAGKQAVRARVTIAGTVLTSAERTVVVRKAKGAKRTPVRAGRFTGRLSLAFTVRGRTLQGFRADVPLLCPTPGMVGQFTTQIATAALPTVKLAPDGSFVAATVRPGAAIRVRGKLKGAKMSGRVQMTLGPCAGDRALAASR